MREVVVRYPHGHVSKLTTVAAPHLTQRGTLLGNLIEPVSIRELGTFWLSEGKGMRHVGGQSEGQFWSNEVNLRVK